jgi:hypothetical protein
MGKVGCGCLALLTALYIGVLGSCAIREYARDGKIEEPRDYLYDLAPVGGLIVGGLALKGGRKFLNYASK